MAVFTGIDMKRWRESQNMSAADLAERISCDTTTVYRYESGKLKPNPDVMYEICVVLGDPDKWTTWMRTEYPTSYGRIHPETSSLNLQGALMRMFAEIEDVLLIRAKVLKDGSDGKIDDPELIKTIENQVTETIKSAQRVRTLLKGCD